MHMTKKIIKKIEEIVGDKYLVTAREDLMCYSYDGTGEEYLPGAGHGQPERIR